MSVAEKQAGPNIIDDVVTITDQQSNKSLDSPPFMFKKEIK